MKISIRTDNAAFEDNWREETARILRGLAARIENGQDPSKLIDYNGNVVGTVSYGKGGKVAMLKRYSINHFAIDDTCQSPMIYGSPRKADIDGLLLRHPTWKRLAPRTARKLLTPRGSGIQFLQAGCGNAERCGWGAGYVPAAIVPLAD